MTDTYSINTTKGKEFEVEGELKQIGLHPWVPKQIKSRYFKESREAVWYDRAYIPKLVICVIPAIYWPDVMGLKHVIGKPLEFSRRDIDGVPGYTMKTDGRYVPPVPGLRQFREAVEAEYAEAERLRENSDYQCHFKPGQAVELLKGPFEGFSATFNGVICRAHDQYPRLKVSVEVFGRETFVEVDPDAVA